MHPVAARPPNHQRPSPSGRKESPDPRQSNHRTMSRKRSPCRFARRSGVDGTPLPDPNRADDLTRMPRWRAIAATAPSSQNQDRHGKSGRIKRLGQIENGLFPLTRSACSSTRRRACPVEKLRQDPRPRRLRTCNETVRTIVRMAHDQRNEIGPVAKLDGRHAQHAEPIRCRSVAGETGRLGPLHVCARSDTVRKAHR